MNTKKTLGELLSKSADYELLGLPNTLVGSIAYDSRKVKQGACFVAIKGEQTDGHLYIETAINNGAKAIVCEKLPPDEIISNDVAFILTKNSRKLLAEISHSYFDFPASKLKIIGVTGTNGKTTTTFIIKSIIESDNLTCGIIGTTGVFIGDRALDATHTTPESLELAEILHDMVIANVKFVVMEVSSHSLIQYRVHSIDFVAAIFTNLTHDHLDYHLTMEKYAYAKRILFESLSMESFAIINTESEFANVMTNGIKCKQIVRVGRNTDNDFRIMREHESLRGTEFLLYSDKNFIDVVTSLAGSFNIDNAAISAATCISLGISLQAIQKGLSTTNGAPGRMQRINLNNGAVALVDYAHTPDALEKALLSCKNMIDSNAVSNPKLICVFGCGGDRDKTKRPEMGSIASKIANITIITSDNPRTEEPKAIIEDILTGVAKESIVEVIEDRADAIKRAISISSKDDLILVAGKGHEKYQIIGKDKFHFDDVEQITSLSL